MSESLIRSLLWIKNERFAPKFDERISNPGHSTSLSSGLFGLTSGSDLLAFLLVFLLSWSFVLPPDLLTNFSSGLFLVYLFFLLVFLLVFLLIFLLVFLVLLEG